MVGKMSTNQLIQAKVHRLEELRKYQAYYGPNTPYPVVVEINDLEIEVQRLLAAKQAAGAKGRKKTASSGKAKPKKKAVPVWQFWRMSQKTFDAIMTIAFIGFLFLLGAILLTAYLNTRPTRLNLTNLAAGLDPPPPHPEANLHPDHRSK